MAQNVSLSLHAQMLASQDQDSRWAIGRVWIYHRLTQAQVCCATQTQSLESRSQTKDRRHRQVRGRLESKETDQA